MATTSPDRILSLDVIRGIAVMGIFSVNVVGMAMIEQAYFYPPAYGFEGLGDRIMWAANFILVDGKFRSLFSILFGASLVLVIERAVAAGKKGWQVHYPRMIVLLLFGLAHFYLLWWGDILANYALVGMIAYVYGMLGSHVSTHQCLLKWPRIRLADTQLFGAERELEIVGQAQAANIGVAVGQDPEHVVVGQVLQRRMHVGEQVDGVPRFEKHLERLVGDSLRLVWRIAGVMQRMKQNAPPQLADAMLEVRFGFDQQTADRRQ